MSNAPRREHFAHDADMGVRGIGYEGSEGATCAALRITHEKDLWTAQYVVDVWHITRPPSDVTRSR